MKIVHFPALAGLCLVVGACSGMSSIGGEEGGAGGEAGDDSGGTAGTRPMTGGTGGTRPTTGGSGGTMGMTGGSGGSGAVGPCTGKPCGAECFTCLDASGEPNMGSGMGVPCDTALTYCGADGTCSPAFPVCQNECETAMDCAQIDAPCQMCADGTVKCPSVDCLMGRCSSTYPTCESECTTDAECATIAAPCQMCADGTSSCPKAECLMGRCTTSWPGCGGNDPCAGRECGEPCNPTCTGMNCGMIADVAFMCNADGRCAAENPRCGTECTSAMDCPQLTLCYMCAGGTCGDVDCIGGNCGFTCPPVEPECDTARDCVVDTICRVCPDMTCAETACIEHECKTVCDAP